MTMVGVLLVCVGVVGTFLILLNSDHLNVTWQTFLAQMASTLLAVGLISIVWEIAGKRVFADELLRKVKLSRDIEESGIIAASTDWLEIIDWKGNVRRSAKIEVSVAYSATWFTNRIDDFKEFLSGKGNELIVYLPDPDDERIVAQLADRFRGGDVQAMESTLRESLSTFEQFMPDCVGNMSIRTHRRVPLFASYRFDDTTLITLYSHHPGRGKVPGIVAKTSGSFGEFFKNDLKKMKTESQVYRESQT